MRQILGSDESDWELLRDPQAEHTFLSFSAVWFNFKTVLAGLTSSWEAFFSWIKCQNYIPPHSNVGELIALILNLFQFQQMLWGFPLDYKYLKQWIVSLFNFEVWFERGVITIQFFTLDCVGFQEAIISCTAGALLPNQPLFVETCETYTSILTAWGMAVHHHRTQRHSWSSKLAEAITIKCFLTEWNCWFIFSHFSCIILVMTCLYSKCVEILIHCLPFIC